MKKIRAQALAAAFSFFLAAFFGIGCESDEAKLERLFRDFSAEFFRRFPDSAAVVGLRLEAEKCLEPPSRAVLEANFRWLEAFEKETKTLSAAPFSIENERKRQLLIQKTALLKKRLEPKKMDASLFSPQKIWRGGLENEKMDAAARQVFFEKTVARSPAFLDGARSLGLDFFDASTFEKAEDEARAAYFFLKKKAASRADGEPFRAALLALKDWAAFCESGRKTNATR